MSLKLNYEFKDEAVPNLKLKVIGVCKDDNFCEFVCLKIDNDYLVLNRQTTIELSERLLTLVDQK